MLAEATTTGISKQEKPAGFKESRKIARRGGSVAGRAQQDIEAEMGIPVITSQNAADFRQLITNIVEDAASLPEYIDEKGRMFELRFEYHFNSNSIRN